MSHLAACNDNVIKNIANEVARNCLAQNVTVDPEFVIYLVQVLLLNPKYGLLFSKQINRDNLDFFVNECVSMLICENVSIKTLKMQFVIQSNYDRLQTLIDKHVNTIEEHLRPLLNEILDADPETEEDYMKLFRKISIYFILASGLGNPGLIVTLKEGMAAMQSVVSMDDLKALVTLPPETKANQLLQWLSIVAGVRLFNKDCKKGGEEIPDLPFDLITAAKASLQTLSNILIVVMERVMELTKCIEDKIAIQDETGNIYIDVQPNSDITEADYLHIFDLLAFNRQYESFIRKLLADMKTMADTSKMYVDRTKGILGELHDAVKYKEAVPTAAVFPSFSKLWKMWRNMQNVMYLVSTVNTLMSSLSSIQDQVKPPINVIQKMLQGKMTKYEVEDDHSVILTEERLSLGSLKNYMIYNKRESLGNAKQTSGHYQGFCSLCLCIGALVPTQPRAGIFKIGARRYGFCNIKMAATFSKTPQRYINEVLHLARNNPHLINLLDIVEEVYQVKDIENLIVKYVPKTKMSDKDIQTEVHPIESHIEKNYTWDLWEWKRRACRWANIVNCKTHSTQTNYSHFRSEIHSQTVEPRDKGYQTKRDCGVNTCSNNFFVWGLRGQLGYGQRLLDLTDSKSPEKPKARVVARCNWPCVGSPIISEGLGDKSESIDDEASAKVRFTNMP